MWSDYLHFMFSSFHTAEFIILISLIIIDIITGLIITIAGKCKHIDTSKISSKFFIKGIYYKIFNIVIYFMGVCFSFYTKQDIIKEFVIISLIAYESISILENFNILGAPFPEPFKKFLNLFSKKDGGTNDD